MQITAYTCISLLLLASCIFSIFSVVQGQGRVAPGVPPQHYQQVPQGQYQQHPPPPPQQQQFQQQQQQQHYQQQQPPPQQQFQPQQVPVQHQQQASGHHHHDGPPQVFNPGNIQHEKEHIAEHMEVPMDTSKMTDQELQFHYFKMHDADNNNKLDGCELIKSLIHWHGDDDDKTAGTARQIVTEATMEEVVDPLIKSLDINNDGFIDFPEFKSATPSQ